MSPEMNYGPLHFARLPRRSIVAIAFVTMCLVMVEHWIGWQALLAPWGMLTLSQLWAAVLLLAVTYVIRALRLYRYFQTEFDFIPCLRLLLRHNLLVTVLPFRSGEIAFPVLMQRQFGVSPQRSVPTLLWFRGLDLHALILILAGTYMWGQSPRLATLFILTWVGLLFAVFFFTKAMAGRIPERLNPISAAARSVLANLPMNITAFAESWIWTVANWAIKLIVFAWILSFFASVSFLPALFGAIGGEVSSVLPVHGPAGVGSYQAGVAAGMMPFGVGLSDAVRGGVNLHLVMLGTSIVCGFLAFVSPSTNNP